MFRNSTNNVRADALDLNSGVKLSRCVYCFVECVEYLHYSGVHMPSCDNDQLASSSPVTFVDTGQIMTLWYTNILVSTRLLWNIVLKG